MAQQDKNRNCIIPETSKLLVFSWKVSENNIQKHCHFYCQTSCVKDTVHNTIGKSSNFLKLQTLKCCLLNNYLLACSSDLLAFFLRCFSFHWL